MKHQHGTPVMEEGLTDIRASKMTGPEKNMPKESGGDQSGSYRETIHGNEAALPFFPIFPLEVNYLQTAFLRFSRKLRGAQSCQQDITVTDDAENSESDQFQ